MKQEGNFIYDDEEPSKPSPKKEFLSPRQERDLWDKNQERDSWTHHRTSHLYPSTLRKKKLNHDREGNPQFGNFGE